jgi:hypothetical protein
MLDGGGSVMFFGRLLRFWVVHCGFLLGSAVSIASVLQPPHQRFLGFSSSCSGSLFVLLISFSRSWSLQDKIGVV